MNYFFSHYSIKLFLRFFFYFVSVPAPLLASHIVGGQIEARHISGREYEVRLVLFFDEVNGNVISKDTLIQIAAYKKSDDQLIDFFTLKLRSDTAVPYSNPLCERGTIKTNQMIYLDTILFTNSKFADSKGFYLAWERCCRNATVINLSNPRLTGTVFYAEIPPVTIAGFNDSPSFKPIIGDYGCTGKLFKLDFSANDTNGDSLAYHLATPLAGNTTESNPVQFPSSAPYSPIQWASGYSETQIIKGALPLTINTATGELQVIAEHEGLYAFAVVCEEYRNQEKIGEVRREFQIPMTFCPIKPGPHMLFEGKPITDRKDTITYKSGTQVCNNITVIDTVAGTPLNFYIRYPYGANKASATVAPLSYVANEANDTALVSICINGYLKGQEKPYLYQLIVKDDACSTPNTDTLTYYVQVIDTLSKPRPVITTPLPDSGYVKPNEPIDVIIVIDDPATNQIDTSCTGKIEVSVSGLALSNGAQIAVVDNKVNIRWIPDCKVSLDSTVTFKVFVSDEECITPYRDSVSITVKVKDQDEAKNKPIPNFFSPNGDNINDDFAVSDYLVRTCKGGFERIDIFNRWGTSVFESTDESFRWKPEAVPDGMYYFAIRYQSRIMQGYIMVAR